MTKIIDRKDPKVRLASARSSLILEQPFLGTIALNMEMILDDSIPTACTNGKWVKFNPKFIEPLSKEQLLFLVAHEVMHPMFEHTFRLNGRDPQRWNRAADYVINQILHDEKIGEFIPGGCLDRNIYDAGKGYTDGVYNILEQQDSKCDKNGSGGDPGGIGSDIVAADGSPAEMEQALAEMKVKVAQAAQAAKMMGKLSANMVRLVGAILQPKVDWRSVLRKFVEKARTDSRTWARPNRRFIPQGLYLPSISGEALGEIAFAVDCSGSIGQKELDEFAAEIRQVWEDGRPSKLHVLYFDSKVCHYDKFEPGDTLHVEPHGGGGTAFSPVFRYMSENNINPVATIFLTDLCCSDFGDPPEYPVLWVCNMESGKAPWGEVVFM